MVKEYDEGQKGAEWLAILPVEARTTPACTQSHAVGEKVIEELVWGRYFRRPSGTGRGSSILLRLRLVPRNALAVTLFRDSRLLGSYHQSGSRHKRSGTSNLQVKNYS
jgi:hypothetical protein